MPQGIGFAIHQLVKAGAKIALPLTPWSAARSSSLAQQAMEESRDKPRQLFLLYCSRGRDDEERHGPKPGIQTTAC